MPFITIYENTISKKLVTLTYPGENQPYGQLRFEDGLCEYSYSHGVLNIFDIKVKSKGLGIGSLVFLDLTTHARRHWGPVRSVYADCVLASAQLFYRKLGFRPSTDFAARSNRRVPPPEDGNAFSANFFASLRSGEIIYEGGDGQLVTVDNFTARISHRRKAFAWEADADMLTGLTMSKVTAWRLSRHEK